jgi:hypothetical protein
MTLDAIVAFFIPLVVLLTVANDTLYRTPLEF